MASDIQLNFMHVYSEANSRKVDRVEREKDGWIESFEHKFQGKMLEDVTYKQMNS